MYIYYFDVPPTSDSISMASSGAASFTCRKSIRVTAIRILLFTIGLWFLFALLSSRGTNVFLVIISAESFKQPLTANTEGRNMNGTTFREKWKTTIANDDVLRFRRNYLRECVNYNGTYTMDIDDTRNRKFTGGKHSNSRGFGSALNAVLPAFMLTQFVDPPRRFHLKAKNWNYGDFRETFSDFTDGSHCPISNYTPAMASGATDVYISHWSASVVVDGPHTLFEYYVFPHVRAHDMVYWNLHHLMGLERYFNTMSVTARAFLIPKPAVFRIIERIWMELSNGGTSYTFVHVRRGDKRTEAEDVPISAYVDAVLEKKNSAESIFLMCDGYKTCDEFSLALVGRYRLFNYRMLVEQWGMGNTTRMSEEHTQETFDQLPHEDRLAQTVELVVSLYIGALADFVVCTYSSNICRLTALLRGGKMNSNGIQSLDWPTWRSV